MILGTSQILKKFKELKNKQQTSLSKKILATTIQILYEAKQQ